MKDLLNIIEQTSFKERTEEESLDVSLNPKTTGKFGTGFMTTFLLSGEVDVEGIIYNERTKTYQEFLLHLDRKTDIPRMCENLKKSYLVFADLNDPMKCPAIMNYDQQYKGKLNTKFTYNITNDQGKDAMNAGLKHFNRCIPLVLSFNSLLGTVSLKDDRASVTSKRSISISNIT